MEVPVLMPKLGLIMTEGRIARWLKSVGDAVSDGEPLLVVETEKVAIDVQSPAAGVLSRIGFEADSTVPVGTVIGAIVTPEHESSNQAEAVNRPGCSDGQTPSSEWPAPRVDAKPPPGPSATPIARRMAKEKGVDLDLVHGTGARGAITERDVLAFLDSQRAEKSDGQLVDEIVDLTAVRRVAAERLTESFHSTPHFYLSVQANMSALNNLKDRLAGEAGRTTTLTPTVTDLLLWFVFRTLVKHPEVNSSWEAGRIRLHRQTGVALAIATDQGLVTPVFLARDLQGIGEIVQRRTDLTLRARAGKLMPDDFVGSTFTLTNLGMYGIDTFAPIINPPNSAILAVGAIKDGVVAQEGKAVVRPVAHFTLAADHRVLDGVAGALFLSDLVALIESPSDVNSSAFRDA
jgi:pyruvate dehydrogenase E2 component (dihydrolipoamide acetyltransferase)